MTLKEHAAIVGTLAADLSMALRNAANEGFQVKATVVKVGLAGTDRRIPRVNVEVV